MKNREIVEKILSYHPHIPNYHGCDSWKAGDPEAECTGIVTALVPTVNVIRKASALGANLLIVHEPTFYTSQDGPGWFEDFPNRVYAEKRQLLEESGIAIWRDHDHMHFHQPDSIFTGVLKGLGWEDRAHVDHSTGCYAHYLVNLPEMTLEALCHHLMHAIGMNGLRYIGKPDMPVRTVALVGHLFPEDHGLKHRDGSPAEYSVQVIKVLEEQADVIIPGEVIDWTVLSYVRDAVQQGRNKAVINLGHLNWEELGMQYAAEWIGRLVDRQVNVTYVPSEDMYQFLLP